jgi:hypothetical protein
MWRSAVGSNAKHKMNIDLLLGIREDFLKGDTVTIPRYPCACRLPVGDLRKLRTPAGMEEIEVVAIAYPDPP